MPVYGEGQTLKNVRETKTILNIELLFAKVDLLRTLTRGKKALLQSLWWSDLWLKSCYSTKEEKTTNLKKIEQFPIEKSPFLTNLWLKSEITILCTFQNQNATYVALLHSKSNQVKVKVATKKQLKK